MVKKFRVGLALQPVAVALFANSPFVEGRPSGFLSQRSLVWTDTDPDRCGTLPFVFEPGFGFERYVDYMLDVPMYFVYRDGRYIDASGQSFRDFLAGRLPALPGEIPRLGDWTDHLTTAFPEVRLKTFLEMRGADGGPWRRLCALPALWVGLLYDAAALDAAAELVADWTVEEREAMRRDVPRLALAAPLRTRTLRDVALEVLDIAREGLSPPRPAQRRRRGRDPFPRSAVRHRRFRAHPGRRICSTIFAAAGPAGSTRSSPNTRIRIAKEARPPSGGARSRCTVRYIRQTVTKSGHYILINRV